MKSRAAKNEFVHFKQLKQMDSPRVSCSHQRWEYICRRRVNCYRTTVRTIQPPSVRLADYRNPLIQLSLPPLQLCRSFEKRTNGRAHIQTRLYSSNPLTKEKSQMEQCVK